MGLKDMIQDLSGELRNNGFFVIMLVQIVLIDFNVQIGVYLWNLYVNFYKMQEQIFMLY